MRSLKWPLIVSFGLFSFLFLGCVQPAPGPEEEGPVRTEAETPVVPPEPEEAAPGREPSVLVEILVQGNLALAEAETAAEKAEIFYSMSRAVLRELLADSRKGSVDGVRELAGGYARILLEGFLPRIPGEEGAWAPGVISGFHSRLDADCEGIEAAIPVATEAARKELSRALAAATRCRLTVLGELHRKE